MRRTRISLAGVALLVLAIAVAPLLAVAQGQTKHRPQPEALPRVKLDGAHRLAPGLDDQIELFIRLDTPPVAEIVGREVSNGRPAPSAAVQRAQALAIGAQQASLRAQLKAMGVKELSSLRIGANGFRVLAKVRDIPNLRKLPGVVSVARVTLFNINNESSVPWIGAPDVWAQYGDGAGVTIAVIDTGIDYLHANLGGAGNPADYAANDTEIIEPGTFPTTKVIGGYDFAGSSYDAGGDVGPTTPSPDPDPLDVDGHGSHVSGSAAGVGVTGLIGPGVAKGASLYALKVFGDVAGSTSLTSDAIEWALDPNGDGDTSDHVDVINMSLGSDFGSPGDPSAIAAQNASDLGVIVVASAGNAGQSAAYVLGSPSVAPDVISVAASVDGGFGNPALIIQPGASVSGLYDSQEGAIGPPLSVVGPVTGRLVAANPLNGCTPFSNAAAVAGKIALIQRGTCTFGDKHANAEAAGAIGVVVFNHATGGDALLTMGFATASIPSTFIGVTNGTALNTALTNGETVTATLQALVEVPHPELADTLADFTSRGPGHGGTTFKPDVSAPGVGIRSTGVGTGDKYSIGEGTSMASPHVAGLAALLRQQHRYLTPRGIKALIQNSTVTANIDGPGTDTPYPLALQGVGVVRANTASELTSFARPGGVSFGRINPTTTSTVLRQVVLRNLGDAARTYSVSHVPNQTFPGVTVSGPGSVSVPAHGTAAVTLKLKMNPALGPADDAFFSQTEVDGWFVFDDGADALRVGYLAAVDPAAKMRLRASNPAGELQIRNVGRAAGYAEGFTLAARDGQMLDGVPNAIRAFGFRTANLFGSDAVQFGLATERNWETLSAYEVDIYLDVDEDGFADYILVALDLGYLQGLDLSGVVATALLNLSTGDFLLEYLALADLNDAGVVLSVDRHGDFGFLPEGDTTFDYAVLTFDLRDSSFDVQEGSIDLANEIVPSDNGVLVGPGTSTTVSLTGALPGKMLWLFPNNADGFQSVVESVK